VRYGLQFLQSLGQLIRFRRLLPGDAVQLARNLAQLELQTQSVSQRRNAVVRKTKTDQVRLEIVPRHVPVLEVGELLEHLLVPLLDPRVRQDRAHQVRVVEPNRDLFVLQPREFVDDLVDDVQDFDVGQATSSRRGDYIESALVQLPGQEPEDLLFAVDALDGVAPQQGDPVPRHVPGEGHSEIVRERDDAPEMRHQLDARLHPLVVVALGHQQRSRQVLSSVLLEDLQANFMFQVSRLCLVNHLYYNLLGEIVHLGFI
jgi:hypothetical protein